MEKISILNKIKQNYIKKYKKIKKILNIDSTYKINFIMENNITLLKLYNKNNKLMLSGDYNFFGIYQPVTSLWIWASSIIGVNKSVIKTIIKLKEFNYLFEDYDDNDQIANFYYQLLTQDVVKVKDKLQLQWINELLLYLSNNMFYLNPTNSDGNIQFLTLIDIKEKYY